MTARIEVEDLVMRYGEAEVLRGLSFSVDRAEVFALLGPNGAGKTTTVEILEGFRHRTGGAVRVLDTDPYRSGRRFRDRIGIVLQSTAIEPELTVIEATRLHAPGYYANPLVPGDALELVGLTGDRLRRVGVLSGGQRRRLDLALAIVGRPEVLFLDEPTTGFDPEARLAAWRLVDVLRSEGTTIVLTTHYLDEAQTLADRVGVIVAGRLVATGTPGELAGGDQTRVSFRSSRASEVATAVRGARVEGGRVVILGEDPRDLLYQLTSAALDRGWELDDLEIRRPTLDDVYLDLLAGAADG